MLFETKCYLRLHLKKKTIMKKILGNPKQVITNPEGINTTPKRVNVPTALLRHKLTKFHHEKKMIKV